MMTSENCSTGSLVMRGKTKTNKQTGRQAGRQADRQTDRQTDKNSPRSKGISHLVMSFKNVIRAWHKCLTYCCHRDKRPVQTDAVELRYLPEVEVGEVVLPQLEAAQPRVFHHVRGVACRQVVEDAGGDVHGHEFGEEELRQTDYEEVELGVALKPDKERETTRHEGLEQ